MTGPTPKPAFKDALTELIEAPDPMFESVAAYHEGSMDDDERAAFAARLDQDPEARELLDELRSFEAAETASGELEIASEFEVATTLRALRRRSEPSPPVSRRAWPAAAALAILSLGLGGAWLDARRELVELRAGSASGFEAAQIHHLNGGELRNTDEPVPEIHGGTARTVLAITPSRSEAGRILSCTITAVGSEDILVGPFQVAAGEHGVLLVSLERDPPSAGDYELRLMDPASGELVERFPFRWSPSSP